MNRSMRPFFRIMMALFLAVFLGISLCPAQDQGVPPSQKKRPVIAANIKEINFGEVISGEKPSRKIKIMNQGRADLVILKIEFTCGCSVSQILLPSGEKVIPDRKEKTLIGKIKPNESAELEIILVSQGHSGMQKKKLIIFSNDPANRSFQVPIIAKIRRAFTCEPRRFDFGEVQKFTARTCPMVIRSTQNENFKILKIIGLPPYFEYAVEDVPNETAPSKRIKLTLKKDAPVGTFSIKMKVMMDSKTIQELPLYASCVVLPPIQFKTEEGKRGDTLDFKVIKRDRPATKTIEILNKNPKIPYEINKMEFASKHEKMIEVELTPVKKGSHYRLKATVIPDEKTRYFKGFVTLHSNHPDLKQKCITIQGWISKE